MDKDQQFIKIIIERKVVERKEMREILGVKDSKLNTYLTNAWRQGHDIDVQGPRHKRVYVYKGALPRRRYLSIDELIQNYKGREIHRNMLIDMAMNDKKWQSKRVQTIIQQVSNAGIKVVGR